MARIDKQAERSTISRFALVVMLCGIAGLPRLAAQSQPGAPSLTAPEVFQNLMARTAQRQQALHSYVARRVYHVEYHGLGGDKLADIEVELNYQAPDRKAFRVISESGSGMLRRRVLRKLLEAEQEAAAKETRRQLDYSPANYEFRLVGTENGDAGELYVLDLTPKHKNKFLFRGRIWVDARDFAVTRMDGHPAQNPSWWITENHIQQTFQKVGDFWLPQRNQSTAKIRLFGHSALTIDYQNYKSMQADILGAAPAPSRVVDASPR